MQDNFKSGFVTLIGRPNVGKSTLMNRLIGQKIAITSNKPQTTRNRIQTVYTGEEGQIIFLDTPGIHKAKNKLGEYMVSVAERTLKEVDVILWLVEPTTFIGAGERHIAEQLKNVDTPVVLVINKIDTVSKAEILTFISTYKDLLDFDDIVPVSALKGENTEDLMKTIFSHLEEGPCYYDEDTITDQPERQIVAEMIREKALRNLSEEVPHGIAVGIDRMRERRGSNIIDIDATIVCERNSHKGIIIGKQGSMLKAVDDNKLKEGFGAILRFFDTGIAEENMIGIAAGLATTGKVPFASTFAVFGAGRAYEQIRNSICYPNLNVKIAVTHAGLTVGEDGATHQMLEDIALMRALPNMTVIVPADAAETEAAVRWAADYNGPVYIRMGRAKCDDIMDPKVIFSPGKSVVLKDGHDVAIVACGIMVSKALRAAESLEGKGVSARVINLSSIKPIDVKTIIKAAKDTGAILTCEEHTIMGGLGSAVAEVVCKNNPVPMGMVGTEDTFGESGKAEDLLEKYGLTVKHIEEEAIRLLERK